MIGLRIVVTCTDFTSYQREEKLFLLQSTLIVFRLRIEQRESDRKSSLERLISSRIIHRALLLSSSSREWLMNERHAQGSSAFILRRKPRRTALSVRTSTIALVNEDIRVEHVLLVLDSVLNN